MGNSYMSFLRRQHNENRERNDNIMSYSIKILDSKGVLIGKKMDASPTEVLTFIAKGFTVIDIHTGQPIQEQMITESVGISDGVCEY